MKMQKLARRSENRSILLSLEGKLGFLSRKQIQVLHDLGALDLTEMLPLMNPRRIWFLALEIPKNLLSHTKKGERIGSKRYQRSNQFRHYTCEMTSTCLECPKRGNRKVKMNVKGIFYNCRCIFTIMAVITL